MLSAGGGTHPSGATGGLVTIMSGKNAVTTSGSIAIRTSDAGNSGSSGLILLSTGMASSGNSGAGGELLLSAGFTS